MRSPSASRPVTSSTVTSGKPAALDELLAVAGERAVAGHVGEQALQRNARAALDAEGARDLALSRLRRGSRRNERISSRVGSRVGRARALRLLGAGRRGGLAFHFRLDFSSRGGCEERRPGSIRVGGSFLPCGGFLGGGLLRGGGLRRLSASASSVFALRLRGGLAAPGFLPPPLASRSARRRTASSTVSVAGSVPFGTVALTLLWRDVGPVLAVEHLDLAALDGMLAQILEHGTRRAAPEAAALAGRLLGEQRHGAVDADREHVLDALDVGVGAVVQDERPVAAEAGGDRLPRLRVDADLARQRQKLQGLVEVDGCGVDALRDRGALGLLSVARSLRRAEGRDRSGPTSRTRQVRSRDRSRARGRPPCRRSGRRAGA